MFTSSSLKHYREVGFVLVVHPPVTTTKSVNTHELHQALEELVQSGSDQIVLDCAGIQYFYSDTLNVMAQTLAQLNKSTSLFGLLHASPSIEKMVQSAFDEKVTCFNSEPEILSWSMRNPPQVEVEESWVESPVEVNENINQDLNDFEIEQEILENVLRSDSTSPNQPPQISPSKPLKVAELEPQEVSRLSPMEKAALEAQEKLALRRQRELEQSKQKKRKLIAIGLLLLLSLTAGLYLWQKASIDQWLNEFISRLF